MSKLFKRMISAALTASMCISGSVLSYSHAEDAELTMSVSQTQDEGTFTGAVNESGIHGLFDYMYWNQENGSISVDFKNRRGYDFTWTDVDDCLCMTGDLFVRDGFDEDLNPVKVRQELYGNPVIEYRAITDAEGKYFFGAYGWFGDPDDEFFIIDDWGETKPVFSSDPVAVVESDGAVYDVYKEMIDSGFAVIRDKYTYRYYSVRREKKSADSNMMSGTISLYEHFNAFKKLGAKTDSPYEIMLATEGFDSSGTMHVTKNDLYYLPEIEEMPEEELQNMYIPTEEEINNYTGSVFTDLVFNERNGYFFMLFKNFGGFGENDVNETIMELTDNGGYKCSWNDCPEASFQRGLKYYDSQDMSLYPVRQFNGEQINVEYRVDYKPEGSSTTGVNCWLNAGNDSFSIIEAWKDWTPEERNEYIGTETIDGVEYDLYCGDYFFYKNYLSVRKDNKLTEDNSLIEGEINVNAHLEALKKNGLAVADPTQVAFDVTGYYGSGTAEVIKDVVKLDGEDIYVESLSPEEILKKVFRYIPGDLNGDEKVNSFDMVIERAELLKAFNGEDCMVESDIDCSGDTRINDVVLLNKIVLGEEVDVPTVRPAKKAK